MKINKLSQVFCFALLLCLSTTLGAVGSTVNTYKTATSVFDLPTEDILQKDTKELEKQLGRKLRFKEKAGLFFTKRKVQKSIAKTGETRFEEGKTHGLAIASLVCGIVGFLFGGIALSILAIVFGGISLKKIKRSGGFYKGKGMAVAGLILGIVLIGLLLSALALVVVLI